MLGHTLSWETWVRSLGLEDPSPREGIGYPLQFSWASLVAQMVKNPPAMWETWVQSLCWEDPLEKGMATYCPKLFTKINSFAPTGTRKGTGHYHAHFTAKETEVQGA